MIVSRKKLLVLCFLLATNVQASNLLNQRETTTLEGINTQYTKGLQQINIDDALNDYNTTESRIGVVKAQALINEANIKRDAHLFNERLIQGDFDESLSESLRKMAGNVEEYNLNIKDLNTKLGEINSILSTKKQELSSIEKVKSDDLLSLYKQVKDRLIQNANRTIEDTFSGKQKCGNTETLQDCLRRAESSIKREFILGIGSIDTVKIRKFEYIDASQNLQGITQYDAAISYNLVYSESISQDIREELGLQSIKFSLRSNSPDTIYYIDNQKVGQGKHVTITGDYVGIYNVRASNSGVNQSLRLKFKPSGSYYFPFNSLRQNEVQANVSKTRKTEVQQTNASQTRPVSTQPVVKPEVKKTSKPNNEYNYVSNLLLHVDSSANYTLSVLRTDNEQRPIFVSTRQEAFEFCQNNFSSELATSDDYRLLEQAKKLNSGEFWTKNGEVFRTNDSLSSNITQAGGLPFVCVIDN